MKHKLPDIKQDFSGWYNALIAQAGMVDESPTRGCTVIMPYAYALWEHMVKVLDGKIKKLGVQNMYFPLLIPESFLKKEAKHVEGFAPEVAVVTHAGGKALEEPYVIRPTSETIVYSSFARWIKSWRNLPVKINQWANVVRWEMRTRPFLRTTEFLWQEGHTAHATKEEAQEMAEAALAMYKSFAYDYLAIPVTTGEKPESERFAGADATYTFEGLMQDGKALQMGTSHMLAQSFSSSFDISFQDKDGCVKSPFCTSWGSTTRLIGALIMTHGDQAGLVMPPRIAPIQVIIIPIFKSDTERLVVLEKANFYVQSLQHAGIRAELDANDAETPGAKFFHWELRGVPIRLEIGPKDVEKGSVVLVIRSERDASKKKMFVQQDCVVDTITKLLDTIHVAMLASAEQYQKSLYHHADKLEDFCSKMAERNGMYQVGWCQDTACEQPLKQYQGTIRCLLKEKQHKSCFACNKPSVCDIVVAKAY